MTTPPRPLSRERAQTQHAQQARTVVAVTFMMLKYRVDVGALSTAGRVAPAKDQLKTS
jgi:hypothetical protein